jgi:hypothetical protein
MGSALFADCIGKSSVMEWNQLFWYVGNFGDWHQKYQALSSHIVGCWMCYKPLISGLTTPRKAFAEWDQLVPWWQLAMDFHGLAEDMPS